MMTPVEIQQALQVASRTAAEAGIAIRLEFHRSMGPRGAGEYAEVDREIELLIRRRLRGAFPQWSFMGEETGSEGPADAPARWLVDPNDGTEAYLHGLRGSSVSIALIVNERPVLGVVYAPVAPDDDGDMLAWAAGSPLVRNGAAVERGHLPGVLGRTNIVLMSQRADLAPEVSHISTKPARFRTVPSVAYRMALVAAGDGDAAVTLHKPSPWDYAGSHALLLAVGGDLRDEHARPIRYRADQPALKGCFGGSPSAAESLAARDWPALGPRPAGAGDSESSGTKALSRRGLAIQDAALLRRAQGCLLGLMIGDALGSSVEGQQAEEIRRQHPWGLREMADGGSWNAIAGQPSGKAELALALARILVRYRSYDIATVRHGYLNWKASQPFNVSPALIQSLNTGGPTNMEEIEPVVRMPSLAVWSQGAPEQDVATLARTDCSMTHIGKISTDACAVIAIAIAYSINTGYSAEAAHGFSLNWSRENRLNTGLISAIERAARPSRSHSIDNTVEHSIYNAFYQLLHAHSFEDAIIDTVMAGGCTTANAAIAGALLGAVLGREAIPNRWRRLVLSARPIAGLEGVAKPRPAWLWPVDVQDLAEMLLLAGRG